MLYILDEELKPLFLYWSFTSSAARWDWSCRVWRKWWSHWGAAVWSSETTEDEPGQTRHNSVPQSHVPGQNQAQCFCYWRNYWGEPSNTVMLLYRSMRKVKTVSGPTLMYSVGIWWNKWIWPNYLDITNKHLMVLWFQFKLANDLINAFDNERRHG